MTLSNRSGMLHVCTVRLHVLLVHVHMAVTEVDCVGPILLFASSCSCRLLTSSVYAHSILLVLLHVYMQFQDSKLKYKLARPQISNHLRVHAQDMLKTAWFFFPIGYTCTCPLASRSAASCGWIKQPRLYCVCSSAFSQKQTSATQNYSVSASSYTANWL